MRACARGRLMSGGGHGRSAAGASSRSVIWPAAPAAGGGNAGAVCLCGQRPAGSNAARDRSCGGGGWPRRPRGAARRARSQRSPCQRGLACGDHPGFARCRARYPWDMAGRGVHGASRDCSSVAHSARHARAMLRVVQHRAHARHARGRGYHDRRADQQTWPTSAAPTVLPAAPAATAPAPPPAPCPDPTPVTRASIAADAVGASTGTSACRSWRRAGIAAETARSPCNRVDARARAGREAHGRRRQRWCGARPHTPSSDLPRTPSSHGAPRRPPASPPDRRLQDNGDLLVREPTELAHHQRAPLPIRQLAQICDQQRQPCPLVGTILGRANPLLGRIA